MGCARPLLCAPLSSQTPALRHPPVLVLAPVLKVLEQRVQLVVGVALQVAVDGDVAPVANLLRQEGGIAAQKGQGGGRRVRAGHAIAIGEGLGAQGAQRGAVPRSRPLFARPTHMMNLGLKKVYLRFLVRKPRSRARLKSDMACAPRRGRGEADEPMAARSSVQRRPEPPPAAAAPPAAQNHAHLVEEAGVACLVAGHEGEDLRHHGVGLLQAAAELLGRSARGSGGLHKEAQEVGAHAHPLHCTPARGLTLRCVARPLQRTHLVEQEAGELGRAGALQELDEDLARGACKRVARRGMRVGCGRGAWAAGWLCWQLGVASHAGCGWEAGACTARRPPHSRFAAEPPNRAPSHHQPHPAHGRLPS